MNVKLTALSIICSISMFSLTCSMEKKIITIAGSTTMESIVLLTAQDFEKKYNTSIQYIPTGSIKGLNMLFEGKCDMAVSSMKLSNPLTWDAQKKGFVIKEFIIAYDAMVIIINKSNRAKNLFLGQISDIYTGLLKDWTSTGDFKGAITVVEREENSGTRIIMHNQFFESTAVTNNSITVNSHEAVVSYVASHKNAIGYISRPFLNNTVKAVMIHGFEPSDANVSKGYYPLKRELYVYIKEKAYDGPAKKFIDMLLNKEGQYFIKKAGFIPVKDILVNIKQ